MNRLSRLLAAYFPTLSGRVDAALRIRALEAQVRRLAAANAVLQGQADQLARIRRTARIRFNDRTRGAS
ncbi:hypothetical protein [Verrucosispora sp. NA02020]|uniref:hypothetical protein n=1 Tax=Verrucosispora sp. NA02020 TaxID=2742132 RepID=UPI001591ED55|nr:hypothetical protein [Verrucosispora sp. NA02020]QKW15316.1 hypothetical protein HUT12_22855 [Verrucosispora sp. NA02020]